MVRSLYSGISGLRNHQTAMDVTGNNIANVNTTGFKSGRVTFEESMAQLLKGASRPPGNAGGTNPMQVGLGMGIGSIDTILTQGNLQSTGQITDLALEGRAYFTYSNGDGNYYSRNGALQLDSTGRLVSPTNGFTLQGITADNDGNYPVGSAIGDIRIPFGEKAPARSTSTVSFSSNLDSDSDGEGTVTHTNRFISHTNTDTTLTSLFDADGNDLGMQNGDVITISVDDPTNPGTPISERFAITENAPASVFEIRTLEDLRAAVEYVVDQVSPATDVNLPVDPADPTRILGTMEIDTFGSGVAINNLQITNNRPTSNPYVSNTFNFGSSVAALSTSQSDIVMRPALETDDLSTVYDAAGQPLGLEQGDTIAINGAVGGDTVPTINAVYGTNPGEVQTLADLVDAVRNGFSLPQTDATPYRNPSVSINTADTDDDLIPDGSLVIRGQPQTAFALTGLSISATNSDNDPISPTRFNANTGFTEIQQARDTTQHSTSIVVYDESGDAHTMTTTFTHSGRPNEWLWEISTNGGEEILGGNRGRLFFGQDGSPSAFTFDDNATGFRFDPMNGSNVVSVNLDVGSPGSFAGITQFRAPSTTAARDQDGYPMGKLQEISIDEYGEIAGIYTNGVNKSIARIYLAEFNNPAGLLKVGDSMYAKSNNSGEGVMLRAGVGTSTKIKPGALEMSNVELATEFTNMITTQRGYQANARVITTSDSLLQELVQLVR